jgi:hypothetical protein
MKFKKNILFLIFLIVFTKANANIFVTNLASKIYVISLNDRLQSNKSDVEFEFTFLQSILQTSAQINQNIPPNFYGLKNLKKLLCSWKYKLQLENIKFRTKYFNSNLYSWQKKIPLYINNLSLII